MEEAINKFLKEKNKLTVGRPLNILKINFNNQITQIKNFKGIYFKNEIDLENAILDKSIHVEYIYPWSEEKLKMVIQENKQKRTKF